MKTSLIFFCFLFQGTFNSCNESDITNKSQSTVDSSIVSIETSSEVEFTKGAIKLEELKNMESGDKKAFNIKDTSLLKFYANISTFKTNQIDTFSNVADYIALIEREHTCYLIKFKAAKITYEAITGATFDQFYTTTDINPKYIFEGIKIDQDYRIKGRSINIDCMTIGEYVNCSVKFRESSYIYALGAVELDTESTRSFPIKMIKDYEVHLRTSDEYIGTDTIFFKSSKVVPDLGKYRDGLGIDWIGDINGDGKCDFIGLRRHHYTHRGYSLYLSFINNGRTQIERICDYDISDD